MILKQEIWFHIIIQTSSASGQEIGNLLDRLYKLIPQTKLIALYSFEGIGDKRPELQNRNSFYPYELIAICRHMIQIEWGDFFFLDSPKNLSSFQGLPDMIKESLACARIVDNTTFETYVQSEELANLILKSCQNSEIHKGCLYDFMYPS